MSEPLQSSYEFEVSVVMPCLNEERTLAHCIDTIQKSLAESSLLGEIIVADNGSQDRSKEIAMQRGARLVLVAERGYGNALRGGIAAARGRYIVFGDADESYDFADVPRFVNKLREGHELVMGNRFAGKIQDGAMPWLHRYLGNPVLSAIGRLFFKVKVGDFHCGLRGLSKLAYERMELRSTGMEFATEIIIKASILGLRVGEIPIELRPDGRDRPPHLRTWRDGWRHLRFMMLMCPRWLFWWPGILIFLVSFSLALILELGALIVGPMRFSIHTLLVAGAGMIVAVQLLTFAVYTEQLAALIGLQKVEHRKRSVWSLELGLAVGLGLIMLGIGILMWTTMAWSRTGFGSLDPELTMRSVIPAVLCIIHGSQLTFGSFFLGFLNLAKSQLAKPPHAG